MSFKHIKNQLEHWAKTLKNHIVTLYFVYKKSETPIVAKSVSFIVVGYALSPIDLIPDFIPVLGYLDDVILLPLGITLAIKLVPTAIMATCRKEAETHTMTSKKHYLAAGVIVMIWLCLSFLFIVKIMS